MPTVTDSFTRANTSNGTMGSTEAGATLAWQNATNWRINSNQAYNDSATISPLWVINNVYNVTASINTVSSNGLGVAFWVKDASNFWVAYMYSERYVSGSVCNSCTVFEANCVCGGCNVNAITYSKNTATAQETFFSGCGFCSPGSCSGAGYACADYGAGTHLLYTYASCGSACVTRTSTNYNCGAKNSCGTSSSSNSCVSSCSASSTTRKCGNSTCPSTSVSCGGTCDYNGNSNRNCKMTCTATGGGNTNAANSCNVSYNTCPPCSTSDTYARRYYLRVSRVLAGSETAIYNSLYLDDPSSTINFAAIKVITSAGSFQAIGYSDTAMTTSVKDSGSVASGYSDYLNTVGAGICRMDLGTAQPGLGYAIDDFSLDYTAASGGPGDSVGIIQA